MKNILPIFFNSFPQHGGGFFCFVGFCFFVDCFSNCISIFVTQENTELLTSLIQNQKYRMFLKSIFQQMEVIRNQRAVFSQRRNCGPA